MTSPLQRAITGIRKFIYIETRQSIVRRLEVQTAKEEAKAGELQKILEAKQKLVKARVKTQQIMKSIDEVASGKKKENND